MKLLIVDDEEGLCEYLRDFFKPRGCTVFMAQEGEEALKIVREEKPNIILLDIQMPVLSGLDVLKKIKRINKQIKVIMVTVAEDLKTQEEAKRLGADSFVRKPFSISYLEDTVMKKISELAMQKPKILIVDDEDTMRNTLKDFLGKRIECDLTEAPDGRKALDEIKRQVFDLVLLDIKMPGISGTEVLKAIKKSHPQTEILVITKWDSPQVADEVIKEGAIDYIPKPFSLKALQLKVEHILKKSNKFIPKKS